MIGIKFREGRFDRNSIVQNLFGSVISPKSTRAEHDVQGSEMVSAMSQGSGSDTESLTDLAPGRRLVLVSRWRESKVCKGRGGVDVSREARVADFVRERHGELELCQRGLHCQHSSAIRASDVSGVQDSKPVCQWLVRVETFKSQSVDHPHRVASVAKCLQGVGNHEPSRSDFLVQSERFPTFFSSSGNTFCPVDATRTPQKWWVHRAAPQGHQSMTRRCHTHTVGRLCGPNWLGSCLLA